MSKEFSQLNGYGVKDAVARAEIEAMKEQMQNVRGKLYLHEIEIEITPKINESISYKFSIYSSEATPYTADSVIDTGNKVYLTTIISNAGIPREGYFACYFYCDSPEAGLGDDTIWSMGSVRLYDLAYYGVESDGTVLYYLISEKTGWSVKITDDVTEV